MDETRWFIIEVIIKLSKQPKETIESFFSQLRECLPEHLMEFTDLLEKTTYMEVERVKELDILPR